MPKHTEFAVLELAVAVSLDSAVNTEVLMVAR